MLIYVNDDGSVHELSKIINTLNLQFINIEDVISTTLRIIYSHLPGDKECYYQQLVSHVMPYGVDFTNRFSMWLESLISTLTYTLTLHGLLADGMEHSIRFYGFVGVITHDFILKGA